MTAPVIPDRAPLGDRISGAVVSLDDNKSALLIEAPPPAGAKFIASGELIVRYGIRFLGKPHLSIVPGLIAVDYGTFLTGEEAWAFLLEQSNRYPRAEVFGYRNDGLDDMQYVKALDFVQPVDVLVYPSPQATRPAAQLSAVIAPAALELPPRLVGTLPRFPDWAAWQASLSF